MMSGIPIGDLVATAFKLFVFLDQPAHTPTTYNIRYTWTQNLRAVTAFAVISARLHYPGYLTRNISDCDSLSVVLFVLFSLSITFWPSKSMNGFARLTEVHDAIEHLEWKLVRILALTWHNAKRQLRGHLEDRHRARNDFDSLPAFRYSPLPRNYIRLIRLERRTIFSRLLSASVVEVSMDKPPRYEALSYTWGCRTSKKPMLIEGKGFYITTNLHELLRARGSWFRQRLIWVDSICINQVDDTEKSSQIQIMRDIYAGADRAVAWLGDPYDASLATWMMQHIYSGHSNLGGLDPLTVYNGYVYRRTSPHWEAMIKILRSPYFSRAWVCQEAALGHQLQFYIGGEYISWEVMITISGLLTQPETACLCLLEDERLQDELSRPLKNCITLGVLRFVEMQTGKALPLDFLLCIFASLESTLQVDKVYSLLGLASVKSSRHIIPDYSKSPEEVFLEVACNVWESNEEPRYFLTMAGVGHERSTQNLPSWVPDWNTASTGASRVLGSYAAQELLDLKRSTERNPDYKFSASGDSKLVFTLDQKTKILSLKGTRADVLGELSEPLGIYDPDLRLWVDWIKAAQKLVDDSPVCSRLNHPKQKGKFWRTLIMNRAEDGSPAPARYAVLHLLWCWYLRSNGSWPPPNVDLGKLRRLADPEYEHLYKMEGVFKRCYMSCLRCHSLLWTLCFIGLC